MKYKKIKQAWFVYILECGDGTFYTGITNNLEGRIRAHRSGRGAKYTRGRLPLKLVCSISCRNKSTALKKEYAVKRHSKKDKLAMIRTSSSVQEDEF
ncbi:MAG TPA: GIY-YIG nuclease family protein [Chitinivibrionales bacterium]|nr:GIY-YIG nuclease family protein [Chitinivibrionales bacterium]